jgi:dedicator of cytokinesis protein 3
LFHGDRVDDVVQTHTTILHGVTRTNRVGFNDAPFQSRSDIFITINKAINTAAILKNSVGSGYATVSAEIRLSDRPDNIIENCVFRGTGAEEGGPNYESYIVASLNDLFWDEQFKLCIPEDIAPRALLVLKFATVRSPSLGEASTADTEPPLAFAALKLTNDGFFVSDGEHRVKVRRFEQGTPFEQQLATFLAEDTGAPGNSDSALCVETFLCSTRFTEDNTLHSLLHWKKDIGTLATEEGKFKMKEVLRKFSFVSEIEILKVNFALVTLIIVFT